MNKIVALVVVLISLIGFPAWAIAQENSHANNTLQSLLEQVKSDGLKERRANTEREQAFLKNANEQKALLKKAQLELVETKKETENLIAVFDRNEDQLAERSDELRQRLGNLGEMFGVVRQVAQDVSSVRASSLLSVELGARSQTLDKLADSKALPSINELEQLWVEMQSQMTAQAEVKTQSIDFINVQGRIEKADITHVGPFVAFKSGAYLQFNPDTEQFFELARQPDEAISIKQYLSSKQTFAPLVIDPTRGVILNLETQSPDYLERIQQGGIIGYVILVISAAGLFFAVWRLVVVSMISAKMKEQIDKPNEPSQDNPLGRVLSIYKNNQDLDLETIEMKLDEAVLKEIPLLERGQSIIKLLAGVAPLLGLLGTVTGMILTFQSITLFGTSDPKLMAGGISQALVTTVLGLIAAIPLLLMHNLISSRSRSMIQVLDQQTAGLVAQSAEKVRKAA